MRHFAYRACYELMRCQTNPRWRDRSGPWQYIDLLTSLFSVPATGSSAVSVVVYVLVGGGGGLSGGGGGGSATESPSW